MADTDESSAPAASVDDRTAAEREAIERWETEGGSVPPATELATA